MPNSLQWTFLASFVATFGVLFAASTFLKAKLREAGYDPANLILIGLSDKNGSDSQNMSENTLPAWATNVNIQIASLALAILSSAFIFYRFSASKKKPVLDPKEFKEFPLVEKVQISPNTALYRFGLPRQDDVLGLPIGQHISVSAEIEGKNIMRSYTPTSSDDDLGHFDLLVKTYEKGNISRFLSLLKIGDKVRVKGPKGQFIYSPSLTKQIGMLAGGTGITPMLQIIRAALKNPLDLTKLSLIYANVNEEDILLRKELDDLAAKHPHRFKVYYVLNNAPSVWKGGVGFVTKEQIEEHLPPTDANIKILMCGPPPMMTAMKKHLADLKYPAPRTVSKLDDQVFLF